MPRKRHLGLGPVESQLDAIQTDVESLWSLDMQPSNVEFNVVGPVVLQHVVGDVVSEALADAVRVFRHILESHAFQLRALREHTQRLPPVIQDDPGDSCIG